MARNVWPSVVISLLTYGISTAARADGTSAARDVALQFGRVLAQIEENYVDPVERSRLINGAIKGMVAELDPHSHYLPEVEYRAFQDDATGRFAGIGVEVDTRGGAFVVISPIDGSPAYKAGIRSGDRIVSVDGVDVTSMLFERVSHRLRGQPGTAVTVAIMRSGEKKQIEFHLVRAIVHVPSVASKRLSSNIAYVRIKQFQEGAYDEFLAAVAKVRSENPRMLEGFILDLRANPGGFVHEAAAVADEWIDEGPLFTTRHRGRVLEEVRAESGGALLDMPTVVLVNEWTASASELLAGALHDHKAATLLGMPTFGKGSVQQIISLPGGNGLKLTIARYYTPKGQAIQAAGLIPDLLVTKPSQPETDVGRERDLEGHLSGEGQPLRKPVKIVIATGTDEVPITGDPLRMPVDPTQGKDFVLRTAFEYLRGVLIPRAGR